MWHCYCYCCCFAVNEYYCMVSSVSQVICLCVASQSHSKTVLSSLSIHAARRSARAALVRQFYLFFFFWFILIQFPPTRLLSHVYKQMILPNILWYRRCVFFERTRKIIVVLFSCKFLCFTFVSILFCTTKKKLYSQKCRIF